MKSLAALLVLGLLAIVQAQTKSIDVKGTLLCGTTGANDVKVHLLRNNTEEATDILDDRVTTASGMFHIEANTDSLSVNQTELLPALRFYHNCDEDIKKAKGFRTFSLNIPADYITIGRKARKTYDVGTLNLQVIMPKEKRVKALPEPKNGEVV
uniref:Transthyretin-like family protein n=1 Tax=Steinernema glaseri TaxID=37863 RepID=A0A1I8A052_9BILA